MGTSVFAPARESVCLRVSVLPRLVEGGCQGEQRASEQTVDRKRRGGDRGQSPDPLAQGQDSLPGHERWRTTEGWVSGQGIRRHRGNKGRRGAAKRGAGVGGLRPGWSSVQGRYRDCITAVQGLARPRAWPRNPVSQQSPFRKSFISL